MTTETPSADLFTATGWAVRFVKRLKPGKPQRIPVEQASAANPDSLMHAVREAGKRHKLTVHTRNIGGELWAFRRK